MSVYAGVGTAVSLKGHVLDPGEVVQEANAPR